MNHLIKSSALAFAVTLSLAVAPAQVRAGEPHLNGSEVSMLVTGSSVVMVVSGPIFLSAAGVRGAADMSKESSERRDEKRRASAGKLPDLEVKSVDTAADGGRRVVLEDPANVENRATLQWPKGEDDPAAGFTVGTKIAFQPSPQGAGWMLRNPEGAALAFVPTIEAVDESRTRTL